MASTPAITIDGIEHEFTRIFATRVPSGEIVVLDGASRVLQSFTAEGRPLKRIAGPGNGPGEIPPNNLMQLMRDGDSILLLLAPGMATPSVRSYSVSAGFVSSTVIRASDAPRGGVSPMAPLGGGRWLGRVGTFSELQPPRAAGEVRPLTTILGIVQLHDRGRFLVLDTLITAYTVSYARAEPGRYAVTTMPYASVGIASASGGRVWIGDASTGSIRLLDPEGARVAELPPVVPPRSFDPARVAAALARALAAGDDDNHRAMIRAQFGEAGRPSRAPAFTRFVPGPNGEMWVELFREDPAAVAEFRVLDRDARVIGAVTVPAGVRVEDVGRDYVLGTIKDEDDVPSVVLYRLVRR